ncbi:Nuf2 family-domain-containing protein [Tuber borchii]|uniref:Probable kinetochore protein NUF2 n=1 Tax=Tuber borchii TaxID=42251 RepID=A0A2T6ZPY5_TUBBO|nr:Nuf2 family-domain-containing protein [Tuber borchii]
MAYNMRQSNFRGSQSNSKPPGSTMKGKQQQQQYAAENHLLLKDNELVDCISELGIPFQMEDLKKPSPQKIQLVFEMFADLLMGVRKETVEPVLNAAAQQVLEFPETQTDSHTLMAFYVSLSQLMLECGIEDFTFNDLAKPDSMRLTRILSYVINFTRFREERANIIDEHFGKAQKAKEKIEQLYFENEDLNNRLQELKMQRLKEEPMIEKAKEVRIALVADLETLKKRQDALVNDWGRLQQSKASHKQTLEDRHYLKVKTQQENNKIRPYIVDSPQKLQQVITDMANSLGTEKAAHDSLERKSRSLQTSADSFVIVEQDVTGCIKVMEEVEQELIKEEETSRRVSRHTETLTAKQTEVHDVERSEKRLSRQLKIATEKLERTRKTGEVKAEAAQRRMLELKKEYGVLSHERSERDKEMEYKKVCIERIEKEMVDMKETVETEVAAAHKEFAKMKSHVELYIDEMEKCI